MVSLTHEQNINCSQIQLDDMAHEQTIICRSRGIGCRLMKRKKNLHRMIMLDIFM